MSNIPLRRMSNEELLHTLRELASRSRHVEADLLAHLGEVDARDLYLAEGCSSMFRYCTEILHFSEASSFHRIHVARVARRLPILLEHLRRGRIHLAGLSLLVPHLTLENHVELLDLACHKSKRAIEKLLADRSPKPDIPPVIRKLPEMRPDAAGPKTGDSPRAEDPTPRARGGLSRGPRPQNPAPEPLGLKRYKIQFTASQELRDKLRVAQGLLRHQLPGGDLAQVFDRALTALIENARREKFAERKSPRRQSRVDRPARPASRHIPAAIKRGVAARDRGLCAFVGRNGRRCESADFVEYHHVDPWARSRCHSVEGIELRCRAHNAYAAVRDYGQDQMAGLERPAGPESAG